METQCPMMRLNLLIILNSSFELLLFVEERGLNKEDNGKNFTPI